MAAMMEGAQSNTPPSENMNGRVKLYPPGKRVLLWEEEETTGVHQHGEVALQDSTTEQKEPEHDPLAISSSVSKVCAAPVSLEPFKRKFFKTFIHDFFISCINSLISKVCPFQFRQCGWTTYHGGMKHC